MVLQNILTRTPPHEKLAQNKPYLLYWLKRMQEHFGSGPRIAFELKQHNCMRP
jgi:hypothetical protein